MSHWIVQTELDLMEILLPQPPHRSSSCFWFFFFLRPGLSNVGQAGLEFTSIDN